MNKTKRAPGTVRGATTPVREALITAARAVFEEQGFAGAKTREIAVRAGTSEVMLFRYFKSKANLFKEAVFQPFDAFLTGFLNREFGAAASHILPAPARLRYAEGLFDLLGENRKLLAVLINAHNYDAPDIAQVGDLNSLDAYFHRASDGMANYADATGWTPGIAPAIAVRLLFGLIASTVLFREWLFPADMSSDEIIAATHRLIERGLGLAAIEAAGSETPPPLAVAERAPTCTRPQPPRN